MPTVLANTCNNGIAIITSGVLFINAETTSTKTKIKIIDSHDLRLSLNVSNVVTARNASDCIIACPMTSKAKTAIKDGLENPASNAYGSTIFSPFLPNNGKTCPNSISAVKTAILVTSIGIFSRIKATIAAPVRSNANHI